jgi:hypothetical protein
MSNEAYLALLRLAAGQHAVISRRQASDLGVDRHQLIRRIRRGDLVEPLPGVLRVVGSPTTWHQWAMVLVLRFRAILSHRSAGWLHLLDGSQRRPDFIELSVPSGRRREPGHWARSCRCPIGPVACPTAGGSA